MPSAMKPIFTPRYDPDTAYGQILAERRQHMNAVKPCTTQWQPIAWGQEGPSDACLLQLTKEQVDEAINACRKFCKLGTSLNDMTKADFRLPSLERELERRRHSLHDGEGFVKIIGLDPASLTSKENVVIFAGIAKHLSLQFGKQGTGKSLVHIKDMTDSFDKKRKLPAPYVTSFLPPHTDCEGDAVAMYVIQAASNGGQGIFSTVKAVCDDIARLEPQALSCLEEPVWPFDRPKGTSGFTYRPVLYKGNGRPEMFFSRGSLIKSPRNNRNPSIPTLTEEQSRALDAVHFAAMAHKYVEPWLTGTMVFFNNRRILHGREAFKDLELAAGEVCGKRHILRLFLGDEELAGPPPNPMRELYEATYDGVWETEAEVWPMQPQPD